MYINLNILYNITLYLNIGLKKMVHGVDLKQLKYAEHFVKYVLKKQIAYVLILAMENMETFHFV